MADGVCSPPAPARRTFLIEAQAGADVVLRVLGPFAVQDVDILTMEASRDLGRISIRIEAGGLAEATAQGLADRLRAMPAVTGVGLGWRVGA